MDIPEYSAWSEAIVKLTGEGMGKIALIRDDVKKFLCNIKARLGSDLSWELERKVQTCL